MGYFDKITEAAFNEGKNGETIYFPNGIFGKGRLVEDPTQKAKLFKFHKRLHKYLLPLCIIYGLLLGLGGEVTLDGFIPIIIILIFVVVRQRVLIKGLTIIDDKLTFKEVTTTVSKAYHPAFLIFMLLSFLFLQ